MFNFFVNDESRIGNCFIISGNDYNHIKNVLRMHEGDEMLVSYNSKSSLCKISRFENETVIAEIINKDYKATNLPIKIYLFQGLPKSDKMELIIQKSVELGVEEIIPVEMKRCIAKLDNKKKQNKQTRWQAIAESAAKQSKRNSVPVVCEIMNYNQALQKASNLDLFLIPYENKDGMNATKKALSSLKKGMSVGILIGPEGGFEQNEVDAAANNNGNIVSLGKRILRTETAAITAVGMCMLYAEMELEK